MLLALTATASFLAGVVTTFIALAVLVARDRKERTP